MININDNEHEKTYEIWYYDELTEEWVCIYSHINTYEEAISLINDYNNNDSYRIYEKDIYITNRLIKEI